ncbi:MAG TPA: PQQ-binding-like beta-propeller repeat protein [Candidatus Binatia bacterium]|nr:PQQ-binding-like beta-propeller repeat protein [Candidatus Binatia bacterium]
MKTAIFCAFTGLFAANLQSADWPQWRGPQRNGISKESGLLKEWPKDGPKLLWHRKDLGSGYSTPSVVGERLYILSNEGMENESVQALKVEDGKQIWSVRIGKVGPNEGPQYPAARSTPTVDGAVLYALGSDGDLASLETSNGKIRWQKNLRNDFGGKPGKWAFAESPLVDGDALVVTPGGSSATLVALNKKTGDVIWKSVVPGGDPAGYASIVVSEAGEVKQYVQFVEKGVIGVDAKTGKFLWRYAKTAEGSPANIPTPIVEKDYVYTATGRGGGGLIKIKKAGDAFEVEQVYFSPKLPTQIGGAVKLGEYLYGTTGQGLLCAEFLTGNVKWQERGVGAGSLCFADGSLFVHGENGDVALVEASPDSYREKGRFTPPDAPIRGNSKAWAYPVVANGRLYVRDLASLWCYDIKK